MKTPLDDGVVVGGDLRSCKLSLFCNALVYLLSMHWDFLWCVYPDSDLVASDGQNCHLNVITDADGL